MVRRVVAALVLALLVLAAPRVARADESAAELKQAGDAAIDALRFAEGVALYERAYAMSHDPALLYNAGRAYEALANYPVALDRLTAFAEQAPPELLARVPGLKQRLDDVRSHVATLTLTTNVTGARVLLDKTEVGVTPLAKPLRTNAGRVTLEVVAEGYRPFAKAIDLVGGKELVVAASLASKATSGVLRVTSPVVGAEVEVDGRLAGIVPVEVAIVAGEHPLVVRHAGYETSHTSVVVGVDQEKSLSIPLEKDRPITAKWWFWTGIGVVVVAGVITTYALLTEKSPDSGTYPPGRVSGPLVTF